MEIVNYDNDFYFIFFSTWKNKKNSKQTNCFWFFRRMRDEESLVDITFACEGKKIGAHKLVLYSCSPYFKELLKENHSAHPIFYFHDMSYEILKAIIEYMYLGEVHITNDNLKDFIKVAEALQIRGLSKDTATTDELNINDAASGNDIQDDYTSVRRKHAGEHQLIEQTFSSSNKRLRIISEASLGTALNDDDDEMEEETQQPNIKRDASNLQPKVESLEFLDEHIQQQQQQQQQQQHQQQQQQPSVTKQPQSITYMNMDTFTEKNSTVSNQQQHQHAVSRKFTNLFFKLKINYFFNLIYFHFRIHSSWNKSATKSCSAR
jgi:BTB/POZ domain